MRGLQKFWDSGDLGSDVEASGLRILKGYSISLAIGIVLGVLIGSFRSVEAFWESPIGFLRYIPATALTPLFLIWLGIDEGPKVALDHRGHGVLQHRDDRRRGAPGARAR